MMPNVNGVGSVPIMKWSADMDPALKCSIAGVKIWATASASGLMLDRAESQTVAVGDATATSIATKRLSRGIGQVSP